MDFKQLLGSDVLADLSKSLDGKFDTDTISKVLSSALPAIAEHNEKSGSSVQKSTSSSKGAADMLFQLLGDNSGHVTQSVSETTGVSQKQVGTILSAAAPLLLKLFSSNSSSGNGGSMLSMITGLLGSKEEKEEKKEEKDSSKEDALGGIVNLAASLFGNK